MIAPSQSNVTLEDTMKAGNNPKFFQIYIPQDRGVARDVAAARESGRLQSDHGDHRCNRVVESRNGYPQQFHSPLPNANFPGTAGGYGRSPFKENLGWDDIAFVRETPECRCSSRACSRRSSRRRRSNTASRAFKFPTTAAVNSTTCRHRSPCCRRLPKRSADGSDYRRRRHSPRSGRLQSARDGRERRRARRPVLYALSLGGWMGVQGMLEHLNGELKMTMRLAGVKSIADISKGS